HYTRSKTGQRLTIRWEKDMQEVLEKYQAQTASSPYLFPFLVDAGNKSHDKTIDKKQEEVRLYHNAESRISYHLRKFGAKIGIKGKLTLYVARHSWATAARDNNVSISVISEALGHDSETTTQIYLRSIKSSEVDDANAKILAVL
ncbi:MAG: tyrosine-type recombinase/integrase, partial [Segatella copri]|nr:tyrosine-type recombinase/integrase [Segatella copri]